MDIMSRRQVKVNFTGFWPGFSDNNIFIKLLDDKYDVVISEDPDYLFCSCFDNNWINYDCVRIFYTGENIIPDFNLFDYGIGFAYIDFEDRYIRFPNFLLEEYSRDIDLMKKKHLMYSSEEALKRNFCSMVVSKGGRKNYVADEREMFFRELSKYKRVDSGGRFLNNIGKPEGIIDKLEFQKKYKFSLAFENCSSSGYLTEKLIQAFAAGTVPIYWGDKTVTRDFNNKAFINLHDFDSFDKVIDYIEKVDSNDEMYLDMLKQPAMVSDDFCNNKYSELRNFLVRIIEQPIEEAYRRDRIGYGKRQEKDRQNWIRAKNDRITRFWLNRRGYK